MTAKGGGIEKKDKTKQQRFGRIQENECDRAKGNNTTRMVREDKTTK